MKKSMKLVAAAVTGLVLTSASISAFSGQDNDNDHRNDDSSAVLVNEATFSLDQAMSIVLADVPGKIIETEIERDDDKLIWEIEVLDKQNQVFEFEIDANSGEILDKDKAES